MHSRSRVSKAAAAAALACAAPAALAQHEGDFLVRVQGGSIQTGGVVDGQAVYPLRVGTGEFGKEGFANFTNDPGVDSQAGQLIPGMEIGYDILGPAKEWDPMAQQFVPTLRTITLRKSGVNRTTPQGDVVVPGIVFGDATFDAAALFHHHVQFFVDFGSGAGAIDGTFLLTWRLWTTEPGVAASEPVYIVFGQGGGVLETDAAVEWVQDTLIDPPSCVADLNGDGVVDFGDVGAFVNAFGPQDALADVNGDGFVDFGDVGAFVSAFTAGC
jgi:hypothetical protein